MVPSPNDRNYPPWCAQRDASELSPDGTQIEFTSDRDGSTAVWIANIDGADTHRLVDGSRPAWSPDARSITHHAAVPQIPELGNAIAIADLETGETRIVSRKDVDDRF